MYISSLINVPYMSHGTSFDINSPVRSEALIRSLFKYASIPLFELENRLISDIPDPARQEIENKSRELYGFIRDKAVFTHRQFANTRMNNPRFDTFGPQRWFNQAVNYIINQSF
jgi:hypothetical protein